MWAGPSRDSGRHRSKRLNRVRSWARLAPPEQYNFVTVVCVSFLCTFCVSQCTC